MIKIQNWSQKRQMTVLTFKCANNFNEKLEEVPLYGAKYSKMVQVKFKNFEGVWST